MDILSYLLELLQTRKEVGITGLGTFYKKKSPGRFDKEKQSFLPPSYTLQFTADLKEEEALLNFISAKRNISAESASYYISQFTDEIKQKLETDHEAHLENLGRLFFTEHEGLSFDPAQNINYGSEFYGLPSLQETVTEEAVEERVEQADEETFEEIAEAPASPEQVENKPFDHSVIENIELDEVKDDLKNTLDRSDKVGEEIIITPEFIKEQHEEHPNRFGHTPESETLSKEINEEIVAPETEVAKTYLHLEDDKVSTEPIIEAPAFIKEQHIEHPNRFGHDPLIDEIQAEETKSIWPKIIIAIIVLLVIAAIIYYVKPELFNQQNKIEQKPAVIVDSPKVAVDTTKVKQDSIAKTDSVLKANQVGQMKTDSVIVSRPVESKKQNVAATSKESMFHVIAVSYATEAAAQRYIDKVKKIGLNATIAKMEGRRKKVSIASFATRDEAEKQKDILQKRLKGEGFYVKEIKNNTQP